MAKNRIIYLGALIGIGIFFFDYDGWISQLLFLTTLALPAVSLLFSLPSLFSTSVKISVSGKCPRGAENDIVFSLSGGALSLWPLCGIKARVTDLIGDSSDIQEIILTNDSPVTVHIDTAHCGVYECRIFKAYMYDFLGLFRFPVKAPKTVSVTVEPIPVCPNPAPDFYSIGARAMKPKPGGGFSEVHELREYRAGDPLNAVHWKLSAKTDDLIIREAQEPLKLTVVLTVDLSPDREMLDKALDRLKWVSDKLIEMEIAHQIRYVDENGQQVRADVSDKAELDKLIKELMSKPIRYGRRSMSTDSIREADWRWHIGSTGGGGNEDE